MRQGFGGLNIGSIAILAIPLLLMFSKKNGFSPKGFNPKGFNLNFDFGSNIDNKKTLIENIKPYFSFQEQSTLNKVQDIIDIISKFNKVKSSRYDNNVLTLSENLPKTEKKERILEEIAKHLEGKGKVVADNLVDTSRRVQMAKNNLDNHKNKVSSQNINKMDKLLNLFDSLEPIMHTKGKQRIKKIEKVLEVIKKPEDEF